MRRARSSKPGAADGRGHAVGNGGSGPLHQVESARGVPSILGNQGMYSALTGGESDSRASASERAWVAAGLPAAWRSWMPEAVGLNPEEVRIERGLPAGYHGTGVRGMAEGERIYLADSLFSDPAELARVTAHELTHVRQARNRGVASGARRGSSPTKAPVEADLAQALSLEAEADRAAAHALDGGHTEVQGAGGPVPAQQFEGGWFEEAVGDAIMTAPLSMFPGMAPIVAMAIDQEDRDAAADWLKDRVNDAGDAIDAVEDAPSTVAKSVADVPVLGPVAKTLAMPAEFQLEVTGGAVKALTEIAGGLGTMALKPVESAKGLSKLAIFVPGGETLATAMEFAKDPSDLAAAHDRAKKSKDEVAMSLVEGVTKGYKEAWAEERYGEIPGRLLIDVGSFFIPGGAGVKGASTTAKVVGNTGKVLGTGGKALGTGGKALGTGGKALGTGGKALGTGGKALGSGGKATGTLTGSGKALPKSATGAAKPGAQAAKTTTRAAKPAKPAATTGPKTPAQMQAAAKEATVKAKGAGKVKPGGGGSTGNKGPAGGGGGGAGGGGEKLGGWVHEVGRVPEHPIVPVQKVRRGSGAKPDPSTTPKSPKKEPAAVSDDAAMKTRERQETISEVFDERAVDPVVPSHATDRLSKRTGRSEKARHKDRYPADETAPRPIQGHHSFPKFLGGKKVQRLLDLPEELHYLYHEELYTVLENGLRSVGNVPAGVSVSRRFFGRRFRGLSKADKKTILDMVKEHAKAFDLRYARRYPDKRTRVHARLVEGMRAAKKDP